jgi:hypothetical protein
MRLLIPGSALALLTAIGSVVILGPRWVAASAPGSGPSRPGCVAVPHMCSFPDATDTGVPAGLILKAVPGQVSSGRGWRYNAADHEVDVTGNGAVLSGLSIRCDLNVTASNVTIKHDRIVTGGSFGISMRHTTGVIIKNSTISGEDLRDGRVEVAIDDLYGNSTGMVIANDNISDFRTAVQVSTGLVTGNYIHNPGYVSGDHTNGIFDVGTRQELMIYHNTILNSRPQTDAVSLDGTGGGLSVANKTVEDNLLAGGSYTIYGGGSRNNSIANIVIEDNRFSRAYYAKGGLYGPVAYFATRGKGNAWSGNTWIQTGQVIPAPMTPPGH